MQHSRGTPCRRKQLPGSSRTRQRARKCTADSSRNSLSAFRSICCLRGSVGTSKTAHKWVNSRLSITIALDSGHKQIVASLRALSINRLNSEFDTCSWSPPPPSMPSMSSMSSSKKVDRSWENGNPLLKNAWAMVTNFGARALCGTLLNTCIIDL